MGRRGGRGGNHDRAPYRVSEREEKGREWRCGRPGEKIYSQRAGKEVMQEVVLLQNDYGILMHEGVT